MAGEQWQQVLQIGKESTEGTAVPATRKLYVMGNLSRQRAANMVKVSTGTRDNQRDIKLRSVVAGGKLTSTGISADELIEWLLLAIKGGVTPTTALSESTWTFTPGTTLDAATIEMFDGYRAWKMNGTKVDQLHLSGSVGADTNLEVDVFARDYVPMNDVQTIGVGAASAGTFTVTFGGQTSASIAFNATAAAVQAALVAMTSIGAGGVVVTGAAPSWIVTFSGGAFAGNLQAVMTGTPTGLTGGTLTFTHTTSGGITAGLTDRAVNFLQGWQCQLFLDAFGGTAGTTNVPGTMIAWDLVLANHLGRKYFADNTQATGGVTIGELEVKAEVTLEGNALAMAEYLNFDANTKRLARIALGNSPNDAVIGTSALKPAVYLDLPGAWTAVDLTPEDNGTKVYKLTTNYVYDSVNSFGVRVIAQSSRPTAYV